MVVFVADEDALARASHAMYLIVFLEALKSSQHRRVLFWLRLLRAECVVGQGV